MKERKGFLYYFVRNRNGMIGMIGVLLILLIGLVGPMLIAKPDGYTQDILQAPSALHWLGTDNIGLDIFAELVWGARTSLYVSVMAMLIAGVIGIPVGLLCGYNTGWLREVIDGFIDIFMTLPISQLQSNSNYQIESVGSLGYTLLTFSQSNELLQDVNVRKALAASCDREALVSVAMSGAATPMYTPISPVYSDFTASNIRQPEFDTAAAASILENAGYVDTNGDGIRESADGKPLSFTITYKGTMANVDGVMSILSSDFAKAGVELKLQPVDAATFSANVTQGHKYDISYSSWGTIDDVDTTLLTIFGIGQTLNFMEFNSQEQEDLLNAMQSETDYNKRVELLNQWQTWFVENLPCCHLFVPNNTYAADTTNFTGWHLSPGNSAFLACANFVNVHAK